jgi:hypothetical protein
METMRRLTSLGAPRVVSHTPIGLLALTVAAAGPAAAQRRSDVLAPLTPVARQEGRVYRPTYWKEGAAIGAAIVGTTGALVAYELACEFSDVRSDCSLASVLAGAAVGGVLGGITGALVGGAFPAPEHRVRRPARFMLVGAGAGALWGFGAFWQFCLNGCRSEEVALGISATAVGALVGWLIGR